MAVKRSAKVGKDSKQEVPKEPVWTYRGYRLKTSDLAPAMGQLLNMVGQRASALRQRLDTTTNWAIISTGATLSLAFSAAAVAHLAILINAFMVLLFLSIEARRYQNFELWNHLVRQIETNFYMAMLVPPFHPSSDQLDRLIENLLIPHYPISIWDAFGRRLRRRYLLILFVLFASWIARLFLIPTIAVSLPEIISRASVGPVSGLTIVTVSLTIYLVLALLAIVTSPKTYAATKLLTSLGDESHHPENPVQSKSKGLRAWLITRFRPDKCRVLIITNKAELISTRIFTDFGRKVSVMSRSNMYIGFGRSVLTCILPFTEAHEIKSAVAKEDPQSFVIVTLNQGNLGRMFNPLEEE